MTVIRGSITMQRLNLQMDLTTVDVNQKFLNMDEANGKLLEVANSNLTLQGIFADVKYAITARIRDNMFNLRQTNYVLTVRPACMPDFDFTTTEFLIKNNRFWGTPAVTVAYHLFFYKGFANITYYGNYLDNIVMKGYSHFAG